MILYNDTDPFVCDWLRNLIAAGHLPHGDVVETPIQKLNAADIPDTFHTFAGIGGWPLALRMAGWPDDQPVWTGSCPCQPFSSAGKRKGTDDERHLWPAFRNLIAERRPSVVFGEQVASKAGREWLDGVRADLEALGYAVGAADLCAAGVGAPHIRQRLYWVADRDGRGFVGASADHREAEQDASDRDSVDAVPCGCGGFCDRLADRTGKRLDGVEDTAGPRGRFCVEVGGRVCDGLADFSGCGRHGRAPHTWRQSRTRATASGPGEVCERMGEPIRSGSQGHAWHGSDRDQPGWLDTAADGSASETGGVGLVRCVEPTKDGGTVVKHRRAPLEPSLFPLADGIPGRVGLLRGVGNAIVPQVAAAFVRAYMESVASARLASGPHDHDHLEEA